MLFVELHCHDCHVIISEEIQYTHKMPHWGWSLWKSALSNGWARREEDSVPFCGSCKERLSQPSYLVLPVNPMPMTACIKCDSCSSRYHKGIVSIGEHFARDLRSAARHDGWRFLTIDGGKTYRDYCPKCEPDDIGKRRLELMRLVWSKPTVKVARELGVSDKAVEKRCKRLDVPKPPVGFWAKYEAGYLIECISLIPPTVVESLGQEFIDQHYLPYAGT